MTLVALKRKTIKTPPGRALEVSARWVQRQFHLRGPDGQRRGLLFRAPVSPSPAMETKRARPIDQPAKWSSAPIDADWPAAEGRGPQCRADRKRLLP